MLNRLVGAYDRLLDGMAAIAAAGTVLSALWITYEVIMRYFFNNPTIWAIDLTEYTLLWGTFLAAPWLLREGGHVRLEMLLDRLSPRTRHVCGVVSSLVGAAVCAVLLWQGLDATLDAFTREQYIARSWRVPRAAVWAIIPVGSFFLTIEFIRLAIRSAYLSTREPTFADHVRDEPAV